MMTCPTFQIASIKDNRSYNFYSRPVSAGSGRRNLDGITDEMRLSLSLVVVGVELMELVVEMKWWCAGPDDICIIIIPPPLILVWAGAASLPAVPAEVATLTPGLEWRVGPACSVTALSFTPVSSHPAIAQWTPPGPVATRCADNQ